MKSLSRVLALPLALLCLGADFPEDSPFTWSIGPVNDETPCQLCLRYKADKYPDARFFAEIRDHPETRVLRRYDVSLEDERGFVTFSALFDFSSYSVGKSVYFKYGISHKDIGSSINVVDFYIYGEQIKRVEKGEGILRLSQDGVYETSRETEVYDPRVDRSHSFGYHDAYVLRGGRVDAALSERKTNLLALRLEYANPYAESAKHPQAELRLLDHQDDFRDIGVDRGGYRSIKLAVRKTDTVDEGCVYAFGFERPVFYSRIDYHASLSVPKSEPYFLSSDFYLPLREGHDGARYAYQIVLTYAGAYRDEIIIDQSAYSSKTLFGPCETADYCVVIGG